MVNYLIRLSRRTVFGCYGVLRTQMRSVPTVHAENGPPDREDGRRQRKRK